LLHAFPVNLHEHPIVDVVAEKPCSHRFLTEYDLQAFPPGRTRKDVPFGHPAFQPSMKPSISSRHTCRSRCKHLRSRTALSCRQVRKNQNDPLPEKFTRAPSPQKGAGTQEEAKVRVACSLSRGLFPGRSPFF
jgi:hypothetical protein